MSGSIPAPSKSTDEPDLDARSRIPWRRLAWTWIAFWLLLFVLGAQEYLWSGGSQLWRPFVDYGSAALVATALAVLQIRRSLRFDHLLGQPVRWFLRMWAWMPLQLVAFVAAMYLIRLVLYPLAGEQFQPDLRLEVLAYEAFKFTLYYALLGGIQFGMRSYRAWATERLRTEQQAPSGTGVPPEQLLIVDRGATHVVRVADIEWLQSADNYVYVHLHGRSLLMRRTLEALLGDLGPAFARTHRSAAVALARVQSLRPRGKSDATVVLQSGAEVPCSRQHRAALMEYLQR